MRKVMFRNTVLLLTFVSFVKCGNITNCCEVGESYLICNGCNLKEVPHGLDPNITHLDLQNNLIQKLRQSEFQDYPNLEELSLHFNPLDDLHPDAFKGLEKLKSLNLLRMNTPANWLKVNFSYVRNVEQFFMTFEESYESGNPTHFVGSILPEFKNVRKLIIHPNTDPDSRGVTLPEGVSKLDKLDSLTLCYTDFLHSKITSFTLRQEKVKTVMLRSIKMSLAGISNFEFSFRSIDTLIFSNIMGFPPLYQELSVTLQHVKTLVYHQSDFSFEKLWEYMAMNRHDFTLFQSFQNFVMNMPHLSSFPKKILSIPFASLKYFALEFEPWSGHKHYCFNNFDLTDFVKTPQSTTLKSLIFRCHSHKRPDFQEWEVKDLTAKSFMEQVPNIATPRCNVSVSNNDTSAGFRLSTISKHTCISQLAVHLEYLNNTVFFDTNDRLVSTLTFLNLSDTPLNILSENNGFYDLQVLDLQNCSLKDIKPEFLQMPRLYTLNLNDNPFKESVFKGNPFRQLRNLTSLYMDNVSLNSSVHLELFSPLENLETLSLSHNQLTYFPFRLKSLLNLRVLDLSENNIRSFDSSVVKDLQTLSENYKLEIIDLSGNVLSCSCQNQELLQWIKNTTTIFRGVSSYLCYRDSNEKNMEIMKLTAKDILGLCAHPTLPMVALIMITTSVALLVLIFGTFCIYKFRWKLKWHVYKMQRKFRIKFLRMQDIGLDVSNLPMRYHAFVSYSHAMDYEWVRNCLLPKVEGEWGLKLCVGERDFLVGAAIAENIINAIENSNKTLIILTPDFIASEWCDFELHMALTRGHQHVIICYIRNVDHIKLTNVMKRLMKILTYIEYADDNDGRELFWAKLQEGLTGGNRLGDTAL